MPSSYIITGCRTPIGRLLGSLSSLPCTELGAIAIRSALARSGVDAAKVDEVIFGNVLSAGVGQAPARQAALLGGLPPTVAALTINKVCGSGLKSVMLADQAIRAGDASVIIAGGMESMSRAPHLLTGARAGWKFGDQPVLDSMQHDGLWCPFENVSMGVEADYIASSRGVSRADQDAFALQSHQRALAAIEAGAFQAEIVPVTIQTRQGNQVVAVDEGPRADTSDAVLAKLRPAFGGEGTVTAGNSSQISDGAAAVVVVDEATTKDLGTSPRFRIVASATSGVPPKEIFIAPVSAIQAVLKKAGMSIEQIDLFELNEAFAAQCLACLRPLEIASEKVNVNGGAIALGHPIGASGARTLVTLMYALEHRKQRFGLVSLCLGGGNAVAMIIERVE
ncbi:MAG: acetyl-CoA C-acetyltransferase [Planctomycetota bacterium]|nr:acetyl-CoA C-acetyltransferase [Planctomycetota bacterium]